MKNTLTIIALLVLACSLDAQDRLSQFHEYLQNGDTTNQRELLEEWEKESPENAELHTCYFNYYFNLSRDEILTLNSGTPPEGEETLILTDSADQVAGFIGSQINYEQSLLKHAFEWIDRGIALYPERLDMRFGKIYALGQIKDWNSFTKEIIKSVNFSVVIRNQWTWTNNEPYDGGEQMFLASLQDYQSQLYSTMDDRLLVNMQEIAVAVLNHYPEHIESLSNLSIIYLVEGDYDKALEPLLKAEQINPEDIVVLFNIAYAYREKGDAATAISYYEKILRYGDEQAKSQAAYEIEQLKENS